MENVDNFLWILASDLRMAIADQRNNYFIQKKEAEEKGESPKQQTT